MHGIVQAKQKQVKVHVSYETRTTGKSRVGCINICEFSFLPLRDRYNSKNKKKLYQPGIEPGALAWQARILPLNH